MADTWMPGATTRPVVLLGDPVDHSLSPLLHNTAFRALDLDLVYLALPVSGDRFAQVVTSLGAVGCVGANVTVPHKVRAHDACDELSDVARVTGAVNTLWWADGLLHGDNTDVSGLIRVLRTAGGVGEGREAVVLGTGGAARAAVVALAEVGCRVVVVGRRGAAAAEVSRVAGAAAGGDLRLDDPAVAQVVAGADVLVNATPLGMHGEQLPPAFMQPTEGQVVHDLVYVDGTTPWVAAARAAGATAVDGRALLAAQAEDSFAKWTNRRPPDGMMGTLLT